MSATIGRGRITLIFEASFSLKDKRSEVKRVVTRISNQFNCGIAEIEDLDDIRIATLGIVVISTSGAHCDQMLATIFGAIERLLNASYVSEIETERIPF